MRAACIESEQPGALKRLQAVAAGVERLWQEAVSARMPVSSKLAAIILEPQGTAVDAVCFLMCGR